MALAPFVVVLLPPPPPLIRGKTVVLKMDFIASVFTLRFKVLCCGSYIYLLGNLSFPGRKEAVQSVL